MIVGLSVGLGVVLLALTLGAGVGSVAGWWTTRDTHPDGHPFSWWLFAGPLAYHRWLDRRDRT